jgi:hypothetical protein
MRPVLVAALVLIPLSVHHGFLALRVSRERCGLRIPPHRGAPERTLPLGSPRGPA